MEPGGAVCCEGGLGGPEPVQRGGSCGNMSSRGRPGPRSQARAAVWARLRTHPLPAPLAAEAPGCPRVQFPNLGSWQCFLMQIGSKLELIFDFTLHSLATCTMTVIYVQVGDCYQSADFKTFQCFKTSSCRPSR